MSIAVIAGYARSPFAPAGRGALARVRPDDMAADVVRALIARTGVKPEDIEDVILGCAFPEGEQGLNVGPAGGTPRRPADHRGGNDSQSLLRLVDAVGAYRGRPDRARCGRRVHLRRRREHERGCR